MTSRTRCLCCVNQLRDFTYIITTNIRKMLKHTSGATLTFAVLGHTNILIVAHRQLSSRMTCFKRFPFLFPFLGFSCVLFCIRQHRS